MSVKKNLTDKPIEETPGENIQEVPSKEVVEELSEPIIEEKIEVVSTSKEFSWANFLKFLYEKNKSIAVNLERGNLTNTFSINGNEINLEVSFTDKCKIFYDFLNESDSIGQIKTLFSEYIGEEKPVSLRINLIDEAMEESTNFQSLVDVEEGEIQKVQEEKRQKILNNKFIKNAEELFNTKIEKIVLNDE